MYTDIPNVILLGTLNKCLHIATEYDLLKIKIRIQRKKLKCYKKFIDGIVCIILII